MRDQVSHPYKTTGRIMILYILIFTFLDSRPVKVAGTYNYDYDIKGVLTSYFV
jgi:hypothetical protein